MRLPRQSLLVLGAMFGLLMVCISIGSAADDASFVWKNDEAAGRADLFLGEQPVVRYVYPYDASTKERAFETYKPFHHVYGPGTQTEITQGTNGKQFPHHRGVYVGWNKTGFEGQSLDFWHCTKGAHQKHVKFVELKGDKTLGRMVAEIHWNDGNGKPVIIETRTLTARREPATNGWQLDWSSKLASQRGEITLDGDRQHAGFQFRAAPEVGAKNSARYMRPANFEQKPDAIQVGDAGMPPPHIDLTWFAMNYQVGEQRFTVEYFDNPNLPKPALFSERPYGRFGTFFKAKIAADKPLELKYRLVISTGEAPTVAAIQKRYDQFVSDLKSTP